MLIADVRIAAAISESDDRMLEAGRYGITYLYNPTPTSFPQSPLYWKECRCIGLSLIYPLLLIVLTSKLISPTAKLLAGPEVCVIQI